MVFCVPSLFSDLENVSKMGHASIYVAGSCNADTIMTGMQTNSYDKACMLKLLDLINNL